MNNFEQLCFNQPRRWIRARREQYSRLRDSLLSALRKVGETVTFFYRPEDRAMAAWEPEIWLPKIMDPGTPERRKDWHCADGPANRISDKTVLIEKLSTCKRDPVVSSGSKRPYGYRDGAISREIKRQ
jgi:hypothetical protein